eukprot:TRINITY_DN1437_c3_g1_i2.p1 TRINITY_DN1437_c3_g1~~TRINITY_DN1437_c3_g1_i2.p1  ORF type:complete len:357 (+),score=86.19 TRINITY_DN1437_c3_g1_i2:901-1971(+)
MDLVLWDVATGQRRHKIHKELCVTESVFGVDDKILYSIGYSPDVLVSKSPSQLLSERHFEGHNRQILRLHLSLQKNLVASESGDGIVMLWNLFTAECLAKWEGHRALFCPNGKQLALGLKHIFFVSLESLQLESSQPLLIGHTEPVSSLAATQNGGLLASGASDRLVRVWDLQQSKCLHILEGHPSSVVDVVFSRDSLLLASAGNEGVVRIWSLENGSCLFVFEGHTRELLSVTFSLDNSRVLSHSLDNTWRVWDLTTGLVLQVQDTSENSHKFKEERKGFHTGALLDCDLLHIDPSDQTRIFVTESVAEAPRSPLPLCCWTSAPRVLNLSSALFRDVRGASPQQQTLFQLLTQSK